MNKINIKETAISDRIFKKVFENKEILCYYVNTICGCHLKAENIIEKPIEIQSGPNGRGIRLDIRVSERVNEKITEINLEAQTKMMKIKSFNNRKIMYASSLFNEGFKEGDDYDKEVYVKTIFFILENINIIGRPIKKTVLYNESDQLKYNEIEIYEIYIKKLLSNDIEKDDEYSRIVSEICGILVDGNFDGDKYKNNKNPVIRRVSKMISDLFSKDSEKIKAEMKRQFDAEMKEMDDMLRQEGYKQGHKQGLEEGQKQRDREYVLRLQEKGFSIDEIADITGLDNDTIQEILS